ncbi:MAG: porin [Alphaproteobacteria bacterium]|nr:porin [Alphaproteobacteria bacterium]
MKKTLLASAAVAGLVFASAPAMAQMELTIGGHSKNYVGYLDQDTTAGTDERNFDMLRETELHFNGESTLDNGLTFGFQIETEMDAGDDGNTVEESYIYMSGTWGRVNVGSEDGAAYLLQVAAPSADSNIDGIRQYVQPVNYTAAGLGIGVAGVAQPDASNPEGFDYDQDLSGYSDKITYLSPNFNGFQVGASYTPDVAATDANALVGFGTDDATDTAGSAYDIAGRYEGVFNNVGFAFGAGYSMVENEDESALDDADQWNVGLDLDIGAFGLGAVYTEEDTGAAASSDVETLVIGADYTTGPFKFGASYFDQEDDTASLETDRYTGGVIYTAGPGLTFRGSISHVEHDAATDVDATSVMGGVQINF